MAQTACNLLDHVLPHVLSPARTNIWFTEYSAERIGRMIPP
jgi:hypothetical protein